MNYKPLQEKVEDYVLAYFEMHPKPDLVYHNLTHTKEVVEAAKQIANHYQINEKDFFVLTTAAWFHDLGYIEDTAAHEEKSVEMATDFLKKNEVKADIRDAVRQVILATKMPQKPTSLLENMMCDADLFHLGTTDFNKKAKLMRKETELIYGNKLDKTEWQKKNIEFLTHQNYHTDYAQLLLNDQKQININKVKARIEKDEELHEVLDNKTTKTDSAQKMKDEKYEKEKGKKEIAKPSKGIETMFRITSSNNQRLSDMADNKAHIMITVNSIILSLIVSLVLRRLEDNAFLIIPTFILLMVSLACIIFSILATRPSIPDGVFTENDIERKKVNLLFFGNFYKMALNDYSKGMNVVMNDKVFLYETLITDIYSQGVVLGRKYKLLRIAYNIFMFGLIAAVAAYIVTYIAYGKL